MKKKAFALVALMASSALAALAQYTIYPVPQKMTAQEGTAQFSEQVCIVADEAVDGATIARAQQVLKDHGMTGIVSPQQQCNSVLRLKVDPKVAVAKKFDAHTIQLRAQGDGMVDMTITGQHTDATFYGLASLEQMLDEKGRTGLPCVDIQDWADQQSRGIVEGYYGYPYSVAVKKDLMRYMMRLKMNTYLYGAKSDPYHSQSWKDPYPTTISAEEERGGWMTQQMIKDVCEVSHETKVNFIWAIHPGNSFVGSSTVNNDIMEKFKNMHKLGVRQFAVFVDDVSIPSTEADMKTNANRLTDLQHNIESYFNKPGTAAVDTVKPLHFVPQIYCRSFAGSQEQFEGFFRALASTPDYITIYTTGWGVWSVPNVGDYNNTAQYLGREVAWWWNYPCNDNADSQIYPMDMYQNFVDMPAVGNNNTLPADMQDRGMGIVSNPMQQGEVAKVALFSVADYAWHCAGFNNKKSWEASFRYVLSDPDMAAAYKAVAPYLTYNDPSTNWITASTAASTAVKRVDAVMENVQKLLTLRDSETESDRLLYNDLEPWLLKLQQMLTAAQKLYATQQMANTTDGELNEAKWLSYIDGISALEDLDNNEAYIVKTLEGMNYRNVGTHLVKPSHKVLSAVLQTLKTNAIKGFLPTRSTKATALTNTPHALSVSTTAGVSTMTLAAKTYQPKQYAGISMPEARYAEIMVQDTLFQGRDIMYSSDGKNWHTLAPGEQPSEPLRHLIVVNSSQEPQSIKFTKNVLSITPVADPSLTGTSLPEGNQYGGHEVKYLTDGDYSTWFTMNANQKTGDTYTLNYSSAAPLSRVRVAIGTTNGDYMQTGRIEISTDGKNWTKLSPVGKTKTSFTINDMTQLSEECKVLDFDGKGQMARYIRLYNQTANTNKWLRIYEMEPTFATTLCESATSKGMDLPALTDGLAYTGETLTGDGLIYRLLQVNDAEQVVVLDSKGVHKLPVIDPRATQLDCSMDGGSQPRRVYEMFAIYSTNNYDITGYGAEGIHLVDVNGNDDVNANCYDLQGRSYVRLPKSGLYIQQGRKVLR